MPAARLERDRHVLPPLRKSLVAAKISARNRLLRFLANEFGGQSETSRLFSQFLSHSGFSKSLFLTLLGVARGGRDTSWPTRRLAVLMLEHQVLRIPRRDLGQFKFALDQLGLMQSPAPNSDVAESVLKEGYTTTTLEEFADEFRTRLERLSRIHNRISGWKTSRTALAEFIEASGQECRLTLARYTFTPDEVVDEILRQVLTSDGIEDFDSRQPLFVQAEAERGLSILPDFEAAILRRLCASSRIFWVSDETSSEINSLVEYPLTTVVLVIKVPGSSVEFEIKRAGKRPPFSLGVVYARNGHQVAPSHRLDGGNMLWLLRHEATAASKLGLIYREVHGEEAPIPTYVSRNTICSIPTRSGDQQTVNYFTDPAVFEDAFDEMRAAMAASVTAFTAEGYMKLPDLPGDLGLTAQFLSTVVPGQAVLNGTTSFRVDKMAAYLSPDGAARLARLSNSTISRDRARSFADTLLEEALGVYRPAVSYSNYAEYLADVFAIAENRSRADSVYKSILEQIGRLWGTLMGVKGYSKGESFVARNVGIRSVWHEGQWQVRTIFMDHDSLVIPDSQEKDFWPCNALDGMKLDEIYIWGRPGGFPGTVGQLRNLYRISDEVHDEAQRSAAIATKSAYQETQYQLVRNPKLRNLFDPVFIERLRGWNPLVMSFLRTREKTIAKWKERTRKVLNAADYEEGEVNTYLEALTTNRSLLERHSFLFSPAIRGRRGKQ